MNDAQRILSRQNSRTNAIARAVTERYYRSAVRAVCQYVEDAGGQFSGLVALTAQSKVRATLNEHASIVGYHATQAASDWGSGPADDELRRAVRRVTRSIGTLLPRHAVRLSLDLLLEIAASGHPEALPPEVAENIRARVGR
jgi:hypothetical protein